MKKRKATLRFKLTLAVLCVSAVMCAALAVILISASNVIFSKTLLTQPSVSIPAEELSSSQKIISDLPAIPATPVQQAQRSFRGVTIFATLLVLAGGGIFLFWYVKRALNPLESLAEQVRQLDAEHLTGSISVSATGDEIEQLSVAVAEMLDRVNQAYTMQKNFSASAAHELRTPIAAMQAKIEVFRMQKAGTPAQYDALVDTLARNTERLSGLVVQLLELTQQAAVDMEQQVNLYELAEEAAMDLAPLAQQKNVTIVVTGTAQTVGNDCLLQRAIFNLMENAVKYNLSGGKVTVTLTQKGEHACCCVADTGIGIPKELQSHIFDFFFRVDPSRNREVGGNGLGLALVKHIITRHGGTLRVTDNHPQGLCIEFYL